MIETLQLEELAVERHDVPKLLVEWSSPWQEFVTSLRPALGRSEARLAGEAPFGLVPFRIMIPSYLLEAFLIFATIIVQVKITEMRPYVAPRFSSHDVIYYSGDELPRTEDLGGAESGTTGRAGGEEAHHRTQTIKIARGGSLVPRVVDAPNLKLPPSHDAVANLLAIKPNPGPPPLEGMRSSRTAPKFPTTIVAPAPNVIRDYTRNGIAMDAVIAPAPSVSRDQPLTAPNLSARVIPPAPSVSRDNALVAPALAPTVIAPAPNVSRDRARSHAVSQCLSGGTGSKRQSRQCSLSAGFFSQCHTSGPGRREPRVICFPGADGERRRRAAASFSARTGHYARSEAGHASALCDCSATLSRHFTRPAPARQRQCSRPVENSGSSSADAGGQWIVHEQRDGEDFWPIRGSASASRRKFERHEWRQWIVARHQCCSASAHGRHRRYWR